MSSLAAIAARLYEAGQFDELIDLAMASWPDDPGVDMPAGIGELLRLASVAAWDLAKSATDRGTLEARVDLLRARAHAAVVLLNDRDAAAGNVLPAFFRLVERRRYLEARQVLATIQRLAAGHFTSDPPGLYARLFHEKMGYSFLAEGRYGDAVTCYSTALEASRKGSRGHLKVRGALALARYLRTPDDDSVAAEAERELTEVQALAEDRSYPDVAKAAAKNRTALAGRSTTTWVAFEVT